MNYFSYFLLVFFLFVLIIPACRRFELPFVGGSDNCDKALSMCLTMYDELNVTCGIYSDVADECLTVSLSLVDLLEECEEKLRGDSTNDNKKSDEIITLFGKYRISSYNAPWEQLHDSTLCGEY